MANFTVSKNILLNDTKETEQLQNSFFLFIVDKRFQRKREIMVRRMRSRKLTMMQMLLKTELERMMLK